MNTYLTGFVQVLCSFGEMSSLETLKSNDNNNVLLVLYSEIKLLCPPSFSKMLQWKKGQLSLFTLS